MCITCRLVEVRELSDSMELELQSHLIWVPETKPESYARAENTFNS